MLVPTSIECIQCESARVKAAELFFCLSPWLILDAFEIEGSKIQQQNVMQII